MAYRKLLVGDICIVSQSASTNHGRRVTVIESTGTGAKVVFDPWHKEPDRWYNWRDLVISVDSSLYTKPKADHRDVRILELEQEVRGLKKKLLDIASIAQ